MDKKRKILIDATKKLLASNTSEGEVIKSLTDVGVDKGEANEILEQAKVAETLSEENEETKLAESEEEMPDESIGPKEEIVDEDSSEAPEISPKDDFWDKPVVKKASDKKGKKGGFLDRLLKRTSLKGKGQEAVEELKVVEKPKIAKESATGEAEIKEFRPASLITEKEKGGEVVEEKEAAKPKKPGAIKLGDDFWEKPLVPVRKRKESPKTEAPLISKFLEPKKKPEAKHDGKDAEKKGEKWKKLDSATTISKGSVKKTSKGFREVMPMRVSDFDKLIAKGGLKRGDTILLSGGCGTGKTTFGMQSLYNGCLNGERGVYLTLEESVEKLRENMHENFGWDIAGLEEKGVLAVIKIDPLTIARAVEATLTKEKGGLYIDFEQFDLPFQFNLPFKPDRVVVDSLSALSIAFMENEQGYRQYLRRLFETLENYNSVNIVLGETEQEPGVYSRSGIEEFLADGVVVLYNIKIHNIREKALEILKLRSSNHEKKITPYKITSKGMEIYINQELFREE